MSFIWDVCDSVQRANFASLLALEVLGILAWIFFFRKKIKSQVSWWILLFIFVLLVMVRMCSGISGRRYYVQTTVVMICFIPQCFRFIHERIRSPRYRNIFWLAALGFGAGIACGHAFLAHPMHPIIKEFTPILQTEYQKNQPIGSIAMFAGNTKREKQILFYAQLPLTAQWMPIEHPRWTGAQYFREYAYKYNEALPSQMDLYWLLKNSQPEDVQKTLDYMKEKHAFKLVSSYHSQTSGNVILFHLQRNVINEK